MMEPIERWVQQLDILFITNRVQLLRAAYKILGDWERAEDIVQDTYIKITELSSNAQNVKQPLVFRLSQELAILLLQFQIVLFQTHYADTGQ